MIFGLLPLIILGGLIALIVKAVSGRSEGGAPEEAAGVSVRRFFQFVLLLGVLIVVAIGLAGLIAEILPERGTRFGEDNAALAQSISFIVVGAPVFYGLARWTRRRLEDPRERRSFGWAFYLTSALLVSLLTAGGAIYEILRMLFGAASYEPESIANALVWSGVWAAHWVTAQRTGDPGRLRLHMLAGSATGLAVTATAVWFAVTIALRAMYDGLFDVAIIEDTGDAIGSALAGLVIGAVIWWWYWLRHASKAERSPMWNGYVLLVGVLGGLVTAVTSASTALFAVLQWFFGDPDSSRAARHFDLMPGTLAAFAVGFLLWWYHRTVLAAVGTTERTEVARIYDYLVAGVGLLAATGGITTVLVAVIQTLTPSGLVEDGDGANVLMAAITLLVVGLPLWWVYWSRIQRHAAAAPDREVVSISRRVYVFVLFGLGGVVALISLLVLMFIAVEDLIDGRFGGETIRSLRVPLALVVTLGVVAAYHWTVFSSDRRLAPEEARALREVVLVGGNDALRTAVADLHVRVRSWSRPDMVPDGMDPAPVIGALQAEEHERVLVIVGDEGFEVVPFEA